MKIKSLFVMLTLALFVVACGINMPPTSVPTPLPTPIVPTTPAPIMLPRGQEVRLVRDITNHSIVIRNSGSAQIGDSIVDGFTVIANFWQGKTAAQFEKSYSMGGGNFPELEGLKFETQPDGKTLVVIPPYNWKAQ